MTVLAASYWKSNAELIEACVRLDYLRVNDRVLDPTFGKGTWWNAYMPAYLDAPCDGAWDFRNMTRYREGEFDVVAYDPPYVSVGGRKTTGLPEMHERYGLTDAPTSPEKLQELIDDGLHECARVTRRHVLVKCQDYISSGKFWPGTFNTYNCALECGLILEDRFVHLTHPRPQPPRDRQVHARNNLSTLFVFRKAK